MGSLDGRVSGGQLDPGLGTVGSGATISLAYPGQNSLMWS